jgi:hypothetical protein
MKSVRRIGAALGLGLSLAGSASAAPDSISGRSTNEGEARNSNRAASDTQRLGVFEDVGYLGSPGAWGSAFGAGLRLRLVEHFAASADLGYGLLSEAPAVQDRWWVIPSLAVVIPVRAVRFDVGVGAGVGTASGYTSWSAYMAAPFTPTWHATVPAVRGHAVASIPLTRSLGVFARVDVASLLFTGLDGAHAGATDTSWVALSLGFEHRLL